MWGDIYFFLVDDYWNMFICFLVSSILNLKLHIIVVLHGSLYAVFLVDSDGESLLLPFFIFLFFYFLKFEIIIAERSVFTFFFFYCCFLLCVHFYLFSWADFCASPYSLVFQLLKVKWCYCPEPRLLNFGSCKYRTVVVRVVMFLSSLFGWGENTLVSKEILVWFVAVISYFMKDFKLKLLDWLGFTWLSSWWFQI